MAITAKKRASLPSKDFGLPSQHKYPTDTRGRAVAAKGRAETQKERGNITAAQEKQIDRKADARLNRGK